MKLIFTKVTQPLKRDCYVVDIDYEHGDADHRETLSHTVESNDQYQLIEFLTKFNELAHKIETVRNGYCATDSTIADAESWIEVCPDMFAEGVPDYYASMSIRAIHHYDCYGDKFLVTVVN